MNRKDRRIVEAITRRVEKGTYVPSMAFTQAFEAPGRKYVLRPLTFGEAGEVTAMVADMRPPSHAVRMQALRDAIGEAPEDLAAVDAHEAAEDALSAHKANEPLVQEPPEAATEWRKEIARLRAEADTAARRVEVLLHRHAASEHIKALDMSGVGKMSRSGVEPLRRMLVAVEAEGLELPTRGDDGYLPAEWFDVLPVADVQGMGKLAAEMNNPTRVAAGN